MLCLVSATRRPGSAQAPGICQPLPCSAFNALNLPSLSGACIPAPGCIMNPASAARTGLGCTNRPRPHNPALVARRRATPHCRRLPPRLRSGLVAAPKPPARPLNTVRTHGIRFVEVLNTNPALPSGVPPVARAAGWQGGKGEARACIKAPSARTSRPAETDAAHRLLLVLLLLPPAFQDPQHCASTRHLGAPLGTRAREGTAFALRRPSALPRLSSSRPEAAPSCGPTAHRSPPPSQ